MLLSTLSTLAEEEMSEATQEECSTAGDREKPSLARTGGGAPKVRTEFRLSPKGGNGRIQKREQTSF